MEDAKTKIKRCLYSTFRTDKFFANVILRVGIVPDDTIETMDTNGERIRYNPEFVTGLTDDACSIILVHEAAHIAFGHVWRHDGKDHELWNIAGDLAINSNLCRRRGFPRGALVPGAEPYGWLPAGKSLEWYVSELRKKAGSGEPAPSEKSPTGTFSRSPKAGTPEESEAKTKWEIAVTQSEMDAKEAGEMPGWASDELGVLREKSNVPWTAKLRRFATARAKNKYSYSKPNRRTRHLGIIMPGRTGKTVSDVALIVDTSGSMSGEDMNKALIELEGILRAHPAAKLKVIQCDTEVSSVATYSASDVPVPRDFQWKGRGGTDLGPAFSEAVGSKCAIVVTDGQFECPAKPPFPVMWILTGNRSNGNIKYGEIIKTK